MRKLENKNPKTTSNKCIETEQNINNANNNQNINAGIKNNTKNINEIDINLCRYNRSNNSSSSYTNYYNLNNNNNLNKQSNILNFHNIKSPYMKTNRIISKFDVFSLPHISSKILGNKTLLSLPLDKNKKSKTKNSSNSLANSSRRVKNFKLSNKQFFNGISDFLGEKISMNLGSNKKEVINLKTLLENDKTASDLSKSNISKINKTNGDNEKSNSKKKKDPEINRWKINFCTVNNVLNENGADENDRKYYGKRCTLDNSLINIIAKRDIHFSNEFNKAVVRKSIYQIPFYEKKNTGNKLIDLDIKNNIRTNQTTFFNHKNIFTNPSCQNTDKKKSRNNKEIKERTDINRSNDNGDNNYEESFYNSVNIYKEEDNNNKVNNNNDEKIDEIKNINNKIYNQTSNNINNNNINNINNNIKNNENDLIKINIPVYNKTINIILPEKNNQENNKKDQLNCQLNHKKMNLNLNKVQNFSEYKKMLNENKEIFMTDTFIHSSKNLKTNNNSNNNNNSKLQKKNILASFLNFRKLRREIQKNKMKISDNQNDLDKMIHKAKKAKNELINMNLDLLSYYPKIYTKNNKFKSNNI